MMDSFDTKNRESELRSRSELQELASDIKIWMDSNRLKLNAAKTEFIYFGSRQQIHKCLLGDISINGADIARSHQIRYLGVHLDENLTLSTHITKKCNTAMYGLHRIRNIRQVLSQEACETLVLGTVISHLDYANAIFIGLSDCQINKLQRVQNFAAKLVLKADRYSSATSALKILHWLPIKLRVKHKVLTLVWKCLHGLAPQYLKDTLTLDNRKRDNMRSGDNYQQLKVPLVRRETFANRSFDVAGPIWWNELPNLVKQASTVALFKQRLKTHLYCQF